MVARSSDLDSESEPSALMRRARIATDIYWELVSEAGVRTASATTPQSGVGSYRTEAEFAVARQQQSRKI
jgi:hypothetical protein